jgi:hypothetical protein
MSQRFVWRPLSEAVMRENIGVPVLAHIQARLHQAHNLSDAPALPLKPGKDGRRGYPDYKTARGLQALRDLYWRGLTLRSARVIDARPNQVRIGFDNPEAARIAAINQAREPMFWFSPSDKQFIQNVVAAALRESQVVQMRKAA